MPEPSFALRQRAALRRRLEANDFRKLDPINANGPLNVGNIAGVYRRRDDKRIILPGEEVYRKGNFTVFVRTDHEGDDKVSVFYSEPFYDAKNREHTRQYMCKKLWYGNVDKNAEKVINKINPLADRLSAPIDGRTRTRAIIHIHTGYMPNGDNFFDDGVSNASDIIRWALVHHTGILAITPHNDFNLDHYRTLKESCKEIGTTLIPAVELTAPITADRFNGPHIIVLAGSEETAECINENILIRRKPMNMPSYAQYDGLIIDNIFDILASMRGNVIFGAAHPFNGWPSNVTGLMSAVIDGQLEYEEAWRFLLRCDFVEAWNASLQDRELRVDDQALRRKLRALISENITDIIGKPRLNPNVLNTALARKAEQFGVGTSAATDEHITPPFVLDYPKGGTKLGALNVELEAPLTVGELTNETIVRGISDKTIRMNAHVLAEIHEGILRLSQQVLNAPASLKLEIKRLEAELYSKYLKDLAKDMAADLKRIWHIRD